MRTRQIKILPIILVVLLIILQYRLWLQPGGMLDMLRMRKQLTIELQQNELLKKRNQALMQQVQGLKNNNEAVEARARHELGMIKKGETFYQVVK
jgi:cell division protein FtsB